MLSFFSTLTFTSCQKEKESDTSTKWEEFDIVDKYGNPTGETYFQEVPTDSLSDHILYPNFVLLYELPDKDDGIRSEDQCRLPVQNPATSVYS